MRKGTKHSEESKKKMSLTHKDKKCSEETKRKMSLVHKGKTPWNTGLTKENNESLKIMSENKKGYKPWNKGKCGYSTKRKGQKHSEETKRKIGLKNKIKNKGNIPWNKGLTKETNHIVNNLANKRKGQVAWNKNINHSEETKIKIKKARLLQNPTFESSIEKKIQSFLVELKVPFIKHKLISDIEHRYQCDIYIQDLNMVIECDGDYWHNYPNGSEIDKKRNKELKEKNYKLLRLWERDIKNMNITRFRSILCESYYKQIKIDNI